MNRRLALPSALLLCVLVSPAAAAPAIQNLSLRGLQLGAATTLVIEGAELGPETRLLASFPIAQQQTRPGATANRVEFDVTLDRQVPAGIYLLRAANPAGISNPVLVSVDALEQSPFAPQLSKLPVALTGTLSGSTVLDTTFAGRQGQRIVIEVESRRLGANLNPSMHLYDARHAQLAWSQGRSTLGGDARMEVLLPADGNYRLELHDALFRGADPGFFRLKIGEFQFADLLFPLGATRGTETTLELLDANFPPATRVLAHPTIPGEQPAPWPDGSWLASGSRPRLTASLNAELVEQAATTAPQELPAAPVAVSGRIAAKGEQDRYRLAVTPGQAVRVEVLARRIGSPLDGVLAVLNEQGGQLAGNDDRPTTCDPGLDFTPPADAKAVLLAINDLEGRGGADFVYRIVVAPVAQPGFTLAVAEDRWLVPQAGTLVVRVRADRANFAGPIRLQLDPQPPGLTIVGDEIPAGATETLLSLSAPSAEPGQRLARLVGRSADPQIAVEHTLAVGDSPALKFQPWLREELPVAITTPGALTLACDEWATATELPPGGALPLKLRVARAAGAAGPVRISLLGTQVVPKKTVKVNNQDQSVDDTDRALRLETALLLEADQSESVTKLLVPGDLPAATYDLTLRAELLAADKQTVLATAYLPARRFTTQAPPQPPAPPAEPAK